MKAPEAVKETKLWRLLGTTPSPVHIEHHQSRLTSRGVMYCGAYVRPHDAEVTESTIEGVRQLVLTARSQGIKICRPCVAGHSVVTLMRSGQ